MKTYPLPNNEQARLAALKDYEILDSETEAKFDRITELASIICEVPISMITLIDGNRQWFKSKFGLDIKETPRAISFCQYAIMDDKYFEVADATKDNRFEDNELVTADPNIRFYGGYPLIDPSGYALGTLCVIDRTANQLNAKQKRALELLAQEATALIVDHRHKKELDNFDKLFDISNDVICIVGTDGFFKKVNPMFGQLLGWNAKDLETKSLYDLVHPDDLKRSKREISKLGRGANTIALDHRIETKEGDYRILQWVATQEPNTQNVFGIARDITEERQNEIELAEKEERLRIFFENSQGLMCTHDLDGKFLSVNYAGAALLGYSTKEVLEFSLYDITPEPRHPHVTAYLKQIRETGAAEGQMLTCHKDGSPRIWMFKNVVEIAKDGVPYVIGNAIDISERHRLERDLDHTKQFLDDVLCAASEVSIIATDEYGLITVFNTGAEKMLGYEAEEMIGKETPLKIHRPEEVAERGRQLSAEFGKEVSDLQTLIKKAVKYGSEQSEWDYVGKDGFIKHTSVAVTPIKNKAEKVTGYLEIALDITAQNKQREELEIAKVKAEEANVAKSEFLANMSHEIRTPLNGVIGFTDLVLKTHLNETQQQYLSIVNQSANALLSIINDILDFSKIEAGKLELSIEKCDLYEMSAQATDIITYQIQTKGLEMLLNIPYDLPRFIWADSVRLKQIMINLLSNASKFTEKGEIELKIEVVDTVDDLTHFRFSVRDTGIGIKLDKQQKIFEAFSQEDGTTTKKYGGTGLGLTISNKLLGLMKSKLELLSAPGKGSTFYFDLLLKSEQGKAIEWKDIDHIRKVLVVDDNENNRIILNQMLLLKQIRCDEAKNGFEALQFLAKGIEYDAIIMDYHMPYMDGLETIRKIRSNFETKGKEQQIILLHSSSDDEMLQNACNELNVVHRMVKPIKTEDIYNVLSQLYKEEDLLAPTKGVTKIEATTTADKVNILIAEDNAINMLLAKTIIRRIAPNAVIYEAKNGLEALEYCRMKKPDLILMDVQMPEMNGYEATLSIRQLEPPVIAPIIALTAGNVKSEKEKCIEAGMDDFLLKPIIESTLALAFEKWLHFYDVKQAAHLHFDKDQVVANIGEDEDLLKQVLQLTRNELIDSEHEIERASAAGDLGSLNAVGHKLYGTAITSGLKLLAVAANEMASLEAFDQEQVEGIREKINTEIRTCLKLIS
ncbi:PAS domain S-box protein [Pedobacter sp. JCM 36344]|uniref:PAS domain S-box protein n=1 Tax=Pedobacter sp. JCM 36344 TaxID=3374280 RepID=UPI00397C4A13